MIKLILILKDRELELEMGSNKSSLIRNLISRIIRKAIRRNE